MTPLKTVPNITNFKLDMQGVVSQIIKIKHVSDIW